MWLYVAGILHPDVLSPDVDSSVLVGFAFAEKYLAFDGQSHHRLRENGRHAGERGGQAAR
jgi:hypothetical protein